MDWKMILEKMFAVLVILAVLFVVVGKCIAAPFLICDPQAGVTHYKLQWQGFSEQILPAQADGSLKYDLVNYSGDSPAQVWAGSEAILDGVPQGVYNWSTPVPFVLQFMKPSAPSGVALSGE
jgi:hypothetical protein